MTGEQLFTANFKPLPYWWDLTPRPDLGQPELPAHADVVVVGSGYTGLSAALQTARGGRSTVVVDADVAGWGCSTRNGGQVSTSVKSSLPELAREHGKDRALAIIREGHRSLSWLGEFIEAERIDCDFRSSGRFHAAHSPRQYEALARQIANPPDGIDLGADLVPRSEQLRELGTDTYHGGVVYRRHASVDPARLHRGLLERVISYPAVPRRR
jgi:glycine/D-amino acid oxidase-like deaminating enzyme